MNCCFNQSQKGCSNPPIPSKPILAASWNFVITCWAHVLDEWPSMFEFLQERRIQLFDRSTVSMVRCNIWKATYCYQMRRNSSRCSKKPDKMSYKVRMIDDWWGWYMLKARLLFKCIFISKCSHQLHRALMKQLSKAMILQKCSKISMDFVGELFI